MSIEMEEVDAEEAYRLAGSLLKSGFDIAIEDYTDGEIHNLINCLYAVRRGRMARKFGVSRMAS